MTMKHLMKWSRKLWVCRRVDPPSLTIHVFRDLKQLNKYIESESGVWACKLFTFFSDEKLAEFLNYISAKHKVVVHFKDIFIQKTQTHNTVNAN
jgi:hypothetical protein